ISKSFQFEPYHVTDIHRGWAKGEGWWISAFGASYGASEAKQKYEFSVNESGRPTREVKCAAGADWDKAGLKNLLRGVTVEFAYNRKLLCIMKQEGSEEVSKLLMEQSKHELVMAGVVTDGDTQIDISVTYHYDATPLKAGEPTGYIFRIKGRVVGAVEIINKGTVWMHNSVTPETRSTLAAASAVLLMHQDLKKMMERK
ncbi:MAG: hypothetical protein V3W31_00180, partial [Thermodesulfobacteriota bacterium]